MFFFENSHSTRKEINLSRYDVYRRICQFLSLQQYSDVIVSKLYILDDEMWTDLDLVDHSIKNECERILWSRVSGEITRERINLDMISLDYIDESIW